MGASSFKRSSLEDFNKYNSLLVGNAAFVPPFDPATLNPDLWLDAADASTITESGGSVSQWDNKGTLSNFVQATSSEQPSTGTFTLNGLNVLDFSSSKFMDYGGAIGDSKFLYDGTEYFVCVVLKNSTAGVNRFWLDNNGGTSGNVGTSFRADSLDKIVVFVHDGTGDFSNIPVDIRGTDIYSENYEVYSYQVDPGNATAADRAALFSGDTQSSGTNSNTGTPSTANPDVNLMLGAFPDNGASGFFNGQIAELVIVSGANATESNRQATVDYLNEKWGVF